MIKLVASDLDGTLLLPGGVMPEEIFGIIEELYKKGIIFVPASGRQLPNLKELFKPVLDKIAIIAENGGLAYWNGEVVYLNPTSSEQVKRALRIIEKVEGLHPLLSCADCAYYSDGFAPFIDKVHASYSATERVENLYDAADGKIVLKISVWDESVPCAEHGGKILPPLIWGARTMVSGRDWLDVSCPSANKGEALKALCGVLNIKKRQTMGFGDHMNDLEMLEACGKAYVTANAFAGLKAKIKREVPSNAERGVITKLKELI